MRGVVRNPSHGQVPGRKFNLLLPSLEYVTYLAIRQHLLTCQPHRRL